MSRRREKSSDRYFKLICTGRGSHNAAELGHFQDNRYGQSFTPVAKTDVDIEKKEVHELSVDDQLTIYATGGSARGYGASRANLERAEVFGKNPDGVPKTRLRCSRCGRDEQFSSERFHRLADAIHKAQVNRLRFTVDISWLDGYLDP
ncbi:hypothetical protein [Nocardiopsis ganjiahuensis]|uniref:hypothetical protein n=1 Tax=Nocardiopsis ganjiahuensis TaxID=239984 RepID=UPI0012686715|nr:hypothetical protein [Nocardiopsis ganjiahuensis]